MGVRQELKELNPQFNKKALDDEEYICAAIEASFALLGGIGKAVGSDASNIGKFKKAPGLFWKTKKTGDKLHGGMKPNPYFDLHGIDTGGYKATANYLRQRAIKSFGSEAVSAVGSVFSSSTGGVNVTKGGKAASSLIQTAVHVRKLEAIAKKWPRSGPIQDWVRVLVEFKNAKTMAKTADLVGSLNTFVGVFATFATVAIKLGTKITMDHVAKRVAAELHWRAYQETVVGAGIANMFKKRTGMISAHASGPAGPASEILYELFTQRGGSWMTSKIFGKYDVDKFIKEPVGWEAIGDKLKMI